MGSTHTSILEILRNANSSIRVLRSCGSALPGWRHSSLADAVAAEAGTLGHLFAREDHKQARSCEPEMRIIVMKKSCVRWRLRTTSIIFTKPQALG
jgi:hypothetical protein